MKNLISFPGGTRVREEAAAWVARLDRGLSEAELAELRQWLARKSHRRALMEFASLADQMGCLAELAGLFPLSEHDRLRARPVFTYRRIGIAAAACGTLALLFWLAVPHWRSVAEIAPTRFAAVETNGVADITQIDATGSEQSGAAVTEQPLTATAKSFETSLGKRTTVTLQDGSTVTLNTDSRLDVEYVPGARNVYLRRGEAYFSVAHDASRPFYVHVGERRFEAVGTAFNVRVRELGAVEVTVTEGHVRVWSGAPPRPPSGDDVAQTEEESLTEVILAANESAIVHDGIAELSTVDELELDVRLAWQRGMLIFNGEPLESALAEVARYSQVEFVVQDEILRNIRVGGYFHAGDVAGVLIALEQNFGIEAERMPGDRIVLTAP